MKFWVTLTVWVKDTGTCWMLIKDNKCASTCEIHSGINTWTKAEESNFLIEHVPLKWNTIKQKTETKRNWKSVKLRGRGKMRSSKIVLLRFELNTEQIYQTITIVTISTISVNLLIFPEQSEVEGKMDKEDIVSCSSGGQMSTWVSFTIVWVTFMSPFQVKQGGNLMERCCAIFEIFTIVLDYFFRAIKRYDSSF